MKAPSFLKDLPCVSTVHVRVMTWATVAVLVLGVRAASAAPPADAALTDLSAIAMQQLAAASREASTCGEPAMSSPFGAYDGRGAGSLAYMLAAAPPPPPGELWVQCSLPYTQGSRGGDCEGKHAIQWQVLGAEPGTTVTAELFALDTSGNPLARFVVNQGENVQMNSRLDPSDWKFKTGKGTYDIFAPIGMLKVTALEPDGDTATAYCTAIPYVDVIKPSGGAVSESGGEAAIDFLAAVPRTDVADLELLLDGVNVLPEIAANAGGLQNCTYISPCDGTLASGTAYNNVIVDVALTIGVMASNTISGSFEDLSCGGHVVRVSSDPAGDFRRTTPQCLLDDLTESASASVFDVNVTNIGGFPVAPNLITTQVPTEVLGNICAGDTIIAANVNGLQLPLAGQVVVDKGFTPQGDHIGFEVTLAIDAELAQTDLRDDLAGVTTELGTFHPGSNRLVAVATENSSGARAYDRHIFAVGSNIKPLAIDPSATIVNQDVLAATVNSKVQSALQAKMNEVMSAPTTIELKNAFVLGLSAGGAQTIIDSLCVNPLPGDGRTLGQIFEQTVEDVLDNFTADSPLTTFPFEPPCSCNTTVKAYVEFVDADSDFACPLTFENDKITVSLQLPDVEVKVRATSPHQGDFHCAVPVPFPPFVLPSSTNINAFARVNLHDIHFDYTLTEADILNSTTTVGADPFTIGGTAELEVGGGVEYGVGGDVCNFFLQAFVFVLTFGQVDIGPLLNLQVDITEEIDLETALAPAKPNALALPDVRVQEQTVGNFHQKISGDIDSVLDVHITGPTQPGPLSGAGITIGLSGQFATTKVDALAEGNPGFEASEPDLPTMLQMQNQGAVDATVGLSVDVVNSFFYSLAGGGDMKVPGSDEQGCFAGVNVGAVLPADCNTLNIPGATDFGLEAVATIRGICHGIRRNDCDSLSMADPAPDAINGDLTSLLSGTIRGVCHGAKPDAAPVNDTACLVTALGDPDAVAGVTEVATCFATELLQLQTISPQSNVMFCAKGDIPVLRFPNDPAIVGVTSDLAINDISVSLIVDRDGNGMDDGLINDLPGCFSGQQTGLDCVIVAACLDVNFRFTMEDIICDATDTQPQQPGFRFGLMEFLPSIRKVGEVCSGSTPPPSNDEQVIESSNNQDVLTGPLATQSGAFSPPICGAGLDFGGLFTCGNTQVLGLEANLDPKFKEFLALTCDLQ